MKTGKITTTAPTTTTTKAATTSKATTTPAQNDSPGKKYDDEASRISQCASKQGKSGALNNWYQRNCSWQSPLSTLMASKVEDKQSRLSILKQGATAVGVVY